MAGRLRVPLTLSLLAAATLAACDRTPPERPGVVRTDSAGVKLVTSGAEDTVLAWEFEEVGVYADSLGAPYLFNNLWSFNVLTDRAGRVYVLTRDPTVVRFGRELREERTFGRRGSGPGEFEFPMAMGAAGDTIWVMDAAKRGLARFNPDLSPADDRRLDGALQGAEMLAFRQGGLWFRRTTIADSSQVTAVYADTLGSAPLQRVESPLGGPVNLGCVALSRAMPVFTPQVMMHAEGPRLLVNAQPAYELWLYEGPRPIASIRRPLASRAPTAEDVRLLFPDGMRVRFGGAQPDCVVPVEEVMAKQGIARAMPFAFDVVLLSDATMWVLRSPHQAPPVVDVFGSDGVYAGTMRGRGLPLGRLPNGDLLFARDDEESGGKLLVRVKVTR